MTATSPYQAQRQGQRRGQRRGQRQGLVLTPILAGAALVLAGYLVLDRSGIFDPAPGGEPRAIQPRGDLAEYEKASIQIFEENAPSVVHITTSSIIRRTWFGTERVPAGTGTGFIWDEQGHIVTNYHVVKEQEGRAVSVRMADKEEHRAKIVNTYPDQDIAVLRFLRKPKNLRPIPRIGSSKDLKVGQAVFAIGNPFGLDLTLTTGVISALGRSIATKTSSRPLEGLVQVDAAINPGNSGGPLLDSAGRLIGMTTAIVSHSGDSAGIGFAVPVDEINETVPRLIANKPAPQAFLGILGSEYTLRVTHRGRRSQAVLLSRVVEGSGAAAAGVRPTLVSPDQRTVVGGDAVLAVAGKIVETIPEIRQVLKGRRVGEKVQLTLARFSGDTSYRIQEVSVTLGENPGN